MAVGSFAHMTLPLLGNQLYIGLIEVDEHLGASWCVSALQVAPPSPQRSSLGPHRGNKFLTNNCDYFEKQMTVFWSQFLDRANKRVQKTGPKNGPHFWLGASSGLPQFCHDCIHIRPPDGQPCAASDPLINVPGLGTCAAVLHVSIASAASTSSLLCGCWQRSRPWKLPINILACRRTRPAQD